jgi:hypothetical protein
MKMQSDKLRVLDPNKGPIILDLTFFKSEEYYRVMLEECGSISPATGKVCNHLKGHKGKCVYIIKDHKNRYFVQEYWERVDEPK